MTEPIPFNVNWNVRIKLTVQGIDIVRLRNDRLFDDTGVRATSKPIDSDGWQTWHLWEVMSVFGPHIYMGCRVPFETAIELLPEAP